SCEGTHSQPSNTAKSSSTVAWNTLSGPSQRRSHASAVPRHAQAHIARIWRVDRADSRVRGHIEGRTFETRLDVRRALSVMSWQIRLVSTRAIAVAALAWLAACSNAAVGGGAGSSAGIAGSPAMAGATPANFAGSGGNSIPPAVTPPAAGVSA